MPGPKPPSTAKPIPIPIFAVKWHTSPSLLPSHIYAFSGGGGGGKTGVDNFIEIVLTSPLSGETKVKIDTGEQVGVALDAFSLPAGKKGAETVLLAVGIQDSVTFYKIVVEKNQNNADFAVDEGGSDLNSNIKNAGLDVEMVGTVNLGKDFSTNTVAFDPMGGRVAVGGGNGMVCVCAIQMEADENSDSALHSLRVEKIMELNGHIKGICTVTYHPTNPNILLSSARDGTCRLWDLAISQTGQGDPCLDTLQCKIYDPNDVAKKKPIPKKILNPAPGQCIVKGCVFADLQGQYAFTVQSGKRKGIDSFLSVWRITRVPVQAPGGTESNADRGGPNDGQQQQQKPPNTKLVFQERSRIKVSNYPISAFSLSGDYSTIALGDTEGNIILLSAETFKKIKRWECLHDLPVTSLATRPLPVPLAGEDKTGVAVDVITASADQKMCFLTKQRKSTLKPVRKRSKKRSGGLSLSFILFLVWMIWAIKVSYDVCSNEFVGIDSIEEFQNVMLECVVQTVWWASQDRPGIAFVPT